MLFTLFINSMHHSVILNLDNLSEHRFNKGKLFLQELPHSRNVVLLLSQGQLAFLLGLGAESLLEDLEAILGVLMVELVKVADPANNRRMRDLWKKLGDLV